MPLFYITGVSGTGKSSVLNELRTRGFEALGVDEDVYARWVHRESGNVIPFPGEDDVDMHEWYRMNMWVLDAGMVAGLRKSADMENRDVFLCGGTAGEEAAWKSFTHVFALSIDEETLRRRIAQRSNNQFGKTPEELQEILDWHKASEVAYRDRGATLVDATRPLDVVVRDILHRTTGIQAAPGLQIPATR